MAACPPGMQFLIPASTIIVEQQIDFLEVITGWETNNRYNVLDANGIRMYIAIEDTDSLYLSCLGNSRLFNIAILDNMGHLCLQILRTDVPLCGCTASNVVQIWTADNHPLGQIREVDCCVPRFSVEDMNGNTRLEIDGPNCCSRCGTATFNVLEMGNPVGEIRKEWGGYAKETFTKADTFGVSFPQNMAPDLKCLLLGAVFLIDFMFYEEPKDRDRHRHRRHRRHFHHNSF